MQITQNNSKNTHKNMTSSSNLQVALIGVVNDGPVDVEAAHLLQHEQIDGGVQVRLLGVPHHAHAATHSLLTDTPTTHTRS